MEGKEEKRGGKEGGEWREIEKIEQEKKKVER
jgi:hypothetical protein